MSERQMDEETGVYLFVGIAVLFGFLDLSTPNDNIRQATGATELLSALVLLNFVRRYHRYVDFPAAVRRNARREAVYLAVILVSMIIGQIVIGPWGMFLGVLLGWLLAEILAFILLPVV